MSPTPAGNKDADNLPTNHTNEHELRSVSFERIRVIRGKNLAGHRFFSTIPPMTLDVLYHDNQMLAVNKPAGLLTQPSGTDKDNLEDRAKAYIKEVKGKPGNVFLHAVHRLDQVVSGIVLFACTDKALSRLNADMRTHKFTKIYHAVVSGTPPQSEGSLRHFLTHDDYHAEVAKEGDADAKECRLDYRVITPEQKNISIVGQGCRSLQSLPHDNGASLPSVESLYSESLSPSPLQETTRPRIREARPTTQGITLLEIQLHTGRYHQIRAQLAAIGCPILGDEKYGSKVKLPGGAIALHHARLTVVHPVSKGDVVIDAPYPQHWPVI